MSWHQFRLITLTVLVLMSSSGQTLADQSRTWTSADGQFTVEAELVEVDEQVVRLRRTDGQVISVPLAEISDPDREYLRLRRRAEPQNDMKHVWRSQRPARLVELTAQLRTTNSSTTAVTKYVFRVTAPPIALEHQRAVLVSSDVPPAERKTHKNGANEFLEFHFPVAANSVVTNNVKFIVLLIPVDYFQSTRPPDESRDSTRGDGKTVEEDHSAYLQPSKNVESDSPEIQRAAELVFRGQRNIVDRARAAYEFPSKALRFRVQSETLGAQRALQTGIGDCTEYACIFAALCRTQAIPARTVGVFNLSTKSQISARQPNHVMAEAYLPGYGWVPVDPNLGGGRYNGEIGFGRLGNTVILLNREGAWVWSTWCPPNSYDASKTKPKFQCEVSWHAKILKEGKPQDLLAEFRELPID